MARDTSHPLSTAEAKSRLRAAANELSLNHWVSRHTWGVMAVALAGGFVAGRLPISTLTDILITRRIMPLLLTVWFRKYKEH